MNGHRNLNSLQGPLDQPPCKHCLLMYTQHEPKKHKTSDCERINQCMWRVETVPSFETHERCLHSSKSARNHLSWPGEVNRSLLTWAQDFQDRIPICRFSPEISLNIPWDMRNHLNTHRIGWSICHSTWLMIRTMDPLRSSEALLRIKQKEQDDALHPPAKH